MKDRHPGTGTSTSTKSTPSSGSGRSRIQSERQADFQANPQNYKSHQGDGKPTLDVKKHAGNVAISQGAKLMGADPITAMLVGPIIRHLSGKRKSKPPPGHPETIAKSKIKRTPLIDRGGDGENVNKTQTAALSAQAAQPIKPKIPPYKPYYMGFDFQKPIDTATHRPLPVRMRRGGLSGGERFGPPPKKGPDPHGKCPFRPDGIRGVGAVEKGRGVKFIGTK